MNVLLLIFSIVAGVTIPYIVMVHIPRERLKRYEQKLGPRYEIKRIIDDLRVNTCLDQVLIWESFNGDGIARFGNKLKVSVVDQSREQPFRDVYRDFQEMEIYGDAIEIMIQMQQNGSTARYMHDMDDGVYKRIFEGEGAFWTEWFAIGPGSHKTFFFASISTAGDKTPYQLHQAGRIDIAKNALRNKYKRMNRTVIKRIFN